MSVVVAQIDIAASPQEVWDFAMDPDRTLEWVTIAREVGAYSDGPMRPGYKMDQKLCLRGVSFWVHWTLVEVDAPRFARWEGRGPARSKAVIEDRLSAVDGGTRFDYSNEFNAPLGPVGAAASRIVTGGIPEKEANASLQRLKAMLER
ncbi:MAG TPA: SRPBCC family protein [Solirubrobacteraceae bacterium]|nr:SRPBCC family protein [Solirubrobacteraceae bacterium]